MSEGCVILMGYVNCVGLVGIYLPVPYDHWLGLSPFSALQPHALLCA